MSTPTLPPPLDPGPRRITRDEFYRMLDWGVFHDQRVELIEGTIMQMAEQTNLHGASITLSADALRAAFGSGFWIRVQASLDLSPYSVPDPDLAVVRGSPKGCAAVNPTSAQLLVEVSETTLRYDRHDKASLYARSGIADYWIVNLVDRCLEIRRNPGPDASQRFGFGYADVTTLLPAKFASPLAQPSARIRVEDLLP